MTFRTTLPNYSLILPIPEVPIRGMVRETGEEIIIEEEPEYIKIGSYLEGLCSALRIQARDSEVKRSWILYNKIAQSREEHAGFLLGLGLRRQLNSLQRTDIFEYLSQENELTTSSVYSKLRLVTHWIVSIKYRNW